MTIEEGAKIALERMGLTPQEVKNRLQYAAICAPGSPKDVLPEGSEEAWIEYVMETFKRLQTPEGQKELTKRMKQNATKN